MINSRFRLSIYYDFSVKTNNILNWVTFHVKFTVFDTIASIISE